MQLLPRSRIRAVLIDITGVLYDYGASHSIPGSTDGMMKLKAANLPFKLVTNQAKDRSENLLKYLHAYGFHMIQAGDIFSPVPAAVHFMKKNGYKNPYLLVHEKVACEFDCFSRTSKNDDDADCVVIGDAGNDFSYANMNKAFKILTNMQKPILISLGSSRFYRFKGELLLDVGSFVKTLEHATDVSAVVIGKPSAEYFNTAVSMLNAANSESVMIGDDWESDIEAAGRCGITGILLMTGKNQQTSQEKPNARPPSNAALLAPDFNFAVDLILKHNESIGIKG